MPDPIEEGVKRAIEPPSRKRARDIPTLLEQLVIAARARAEAESRGAGAEPSPQTLGSPQSELEFVALSALVMASRDMRELETLYMQAGSAASGLIDRALGPSELNAVIKNPTTRVAMVNRKRNDVPPAKYEGEKLRKYTLSWKKTALTTSLQTNNTARQRHQYDHNAWKADLLAALAEAVAQDANLICFGEFDYPPGFSDEDNPYDNEADFQREVLEILDRSKKPSVAILGSSHRRKPIPSDPDKPQLLDEYKVENVAQVFFSKSLLSSVDRPTVDNPKGVWKVTPASKVGERLSRPKDITLHGFNAVFGRVAVLICSDAYDPSIIFELFARSQEADEKPDFIVVPSYNDSGKFPELCQVLSFMTNTVVVMVDAHDGDNKYCGKAQIWACGIPAEELSKGVWRELDVCAYHKTLTVENSRTCIELWDVYRAGVSRLVDELDRIEPLPVFRDVRAKLKEDAEKEATRL